MARFYVNMIRDRGLNNDPNKDVIGLFSNNEWDGRGNFCGWYGVEYYLNTKLYAHYLADGSGLYFPEKRVSEVVIHDPAVEYDEVQIGSCYWERVIEADNLEEAIEKFTNADWKRR